MRSARCQDTMFKLFNSGAADVKWQAKRALSNLEAPS